MKPDSGEAKRLARILDAMEATGPDARPGLDYSDPWEQLVATVLSAQCTDARVNMVTPSLFARYEGPDELAEARQEELEEVIRSIGLYRNKAKNLISLARVVRDEHGSKVPAEREALESLPGVGRKTASVVLAQAFGIPAFAVDTHVGRVMMRLGFADTKDPVKVEDAATALIPPERWGSAHLLLIRHGRTVCKARSPECGACPVEKDCRWNEKGSYMGSADPAGARR